MTGMAVAWILTAAICAALAAFAGVFALAFWITGGSAWMLAFFPGFVGVPAAAAIPIIAVLFREDS